MNEIKVCKQFYLPAAKRVPWAEPNVEIVTDSGINQAINPSIRLPKV